MDERGIPVDCMMRTVFLKGPTGDAVTLAECLEKCDHSTIQPTNSITLQQSPYPVAQREPLCSIDMNSNVQITQPQTAPPPPTWGQWKVALPPTLPKIPVAITHNPPGSCARLEMVTYGTGMMHCLVTSLTLVKHEHKKKNAMCFHMVCVFVYVIVCVCVRACVCGLWGGAGVGVGRCEAVFLCRCVVVSGKWFVCVPLCMRA